MRASWSIVASSLALTLFAVVPLWTQSDFNMYDPTLRTKYDIRQVHFVYAPESIERSCPELRRDGPWWLYAYWKENNVEFFIISSLARKYDGVGAILTRNGCTVGSHGWVMTGASEEAPMELRDGELQPVNLDKDIKFTSSVLHGLAADYLRRSAEAYGGKRKYLKILAEAGLDAKYDDFPPEFGDEFRKFARHP